MNNICRFAIALVVAFGLMACSKIGVKSVLDDLARDTYEANEKNKRSENLERGLQTDEVLPYDQYQKERKEAMTNEEVMPLPMNVK